MADALPWPLMVLRTDGALVHANLAGQKLLQRGRPLKLTPQRRVVPANTAPAQFTKALQHVAQGEPQVLRWSLDEGPATVALTPLEGKGGRPLVLLALNTEGVREAELRAFAQWHGLNEPETRVMQRLARGESSSTVAAGLGLSTATVRSQIVSLRRKTGHANVPDLIRTLAALPPLPGPGDGR